MTHRGRRHRERPAAIREAHAPGRDAGQGTGLMGFFDRLGMRATGPCGTGALAVAAILTLAPAQQALAQGAVKSVHKDWQVRCDTPPGAKSEQCALIQSVTAE